ncbi:MAG: diguanylate cyclase (GGDEF)-like protein/PAS domain S-box-containing protein [Alteromonadaceae bacterium]|jgi:diguanylate cyclase (GGDEF)-like protein/PAS domain S-box-containing protein
MIKYPHIHKTSGLLPLDTNQIIELFDDLIECIYGVDLNGNCTFCNKTLLKLLKYQQPKQLLGQNMHHLVHHSYHDGTQKKQGNNELWQSIAKGKAIHKSQDWVWCKDGSSIPVEIWAYPFHKNGQVAGAIIAFIDISHRIYTQNSLEDSLEKYRMLIESTQVIPWEYDLFSKKFTFISPQAEEMFGYPLAQWYLENFWEEHIFIEDREKSILACNRAVERGKSFELNYRMIKADGTIIHVNDYISLIVKNVKVTGLRGVFTDISISKIQEEQLRLAAVTFDTDSGIFITDNTGIILKVNKAFSDITGFEAQAVIGQSPQLFKSDRHDDAFFKVMWNDLQKHGRWRGEIWNKNASGDEYPEWLTITAVKGSLGETTHYVAIFTDISEMKAAEDKIKYQAHYDSVTSLPNRVLLSYHLRQAIVQARKFHHCGALLLLDLDEFKVINDSLGHEFGDRLLMQMGTLINSLVSKGDIVARLGGDEFAVLLPDLGGDIGCCLLEAEILAQSLCESIAKVKEIDGVQVHLTASIGLTLFSKKRLSDSDLLKQADTAMYKAKQAGKNSFTRFTEDMQEEANKRLSIQGELKLAIERNQLELYFQPQFNNQKKLSGVEALVRWNHPEDGQISPNDFIPIAEKSGLIIPLGRWVLHNACEIYASWRQTLNIELPRMSVNVSSQQFQQSSFVEMVTNCLATNNLSAEHLELEITEEVLIGNIEETIIKIEQLKKIGISFAIDDFGTGYSSLSYLKKLPINLLKIDRSFITDVLQNKDDEAIVETIIAMTKHMNLHVIAEGVENKDQYEWLKAHGCDYYQGFYFSRPLSKQDFEQKILLSSP